MTLEELKKAGYIDISQKPIRELTLFKCFDNGNMFIFQFSAESHEMHGCIYTSITQLKEILATIEKEATNAE